MGGAICCGELKMCLALPVQIVQVGLDGDAARALVDVGGVRKDISIELVPDAQVGDYVILHVGYALSKLDPQEAQRTLELFAAMEPAQEPLA
jgi:hydrogenase expression/formation protein HypC